MTPTDKEKAALDADKLREAIEAARRRADYDDSDKPADFYASGCTPEQYRLLADAAEAPRVPDINDHKAIDALLWELNRRRYPNPISRDLVAEIIRIMHEPPKPVTKVVQVWAVWWAKEPSSPMGYVTEALAYPTKEAAEEEARKAREEGLLCVRVTGPHDQEVPIEVAPAADGCRGRTLAERRA